MSHSDDASYSFSTPFSAFAVDRLGPIMEQNPGAPREAWGVLNPACARTRQGDLLLFPRVVAEGNYSRIGAARMLFIDNLVFPTALDRRDGNRVDVYYGMADFRIGVGTLRIPEQLPVYVPDPLDSEAVA